MNIYAFVIGIATAFFSIFAIHILLWRKERSRFQTAIGCIMFVWALWCMKDLVLTFPGMYTEKMLNWILIVDGWSALTYTIFIAEVVMPGWTSLRRMLLLSLPFAAFTLAYALWPADTVINIYSAFLWCYAWTVVIIGYVKMQRYLKYIHENYSDIEDIDVSWLRPVFLFAVAGQLAWLFTSLYAYVWADIIYYVLVLALWCMVLWYSWNFRPITIEEKAEATESVPAMLPEGVLERAMMEQRLYLRPGLTLSELAEALGTNRTYVSNYLSRRLHQTFYDYVNQLRIEQASIPLMTEHPEYKLEYIARESGFASISTFRRAFFKLTQQTPGLFCQDCTSS